MTTDDVTAELIGLADLIDKVNDKHKWPSQAELGELLDGSARAVDTLLRLLAVCALAEAGRDPAIAASLTTEGIRTIITETWRKP